MAQQWYWMQDGQKSGPVSTAELKELARTARLKPTDMIWREGLPNWVQASQAKGLFVPPPPVAAAQPPTRRAAAAPDSPAQTFASPQPEASPQPTVSPRTPQSNATAGATPASEMPRQNLYRILNVAHNASADELRKAINRELRVWSNRTNAPQLERRQEAERMVTLLERAETLLLDPVQRAAYDRELARSPEEREIDESDLAGKTDLVGEARRLLIDGEVPDAMYVAERATQHEGNNPEAWAVLAEAKFRWGDIEDAIYEYKRAVKLRPNEAVYYFDLGCVLESAGRFDDALQQYQRAAQIEPSTTMYRAGVGGMLGRTGHYQDCATMLEQCLREQPDNPAYRRILANAYLLLANSGWVQVGEGHPLLSPGAYATEFKQVACAQEYIKKALSLNCDDAETTAELHECRRDIDSNLKRRFTCNWAVAVIIGLLGIPAYGIPTIVAILYVISTYAPQYRVNKQLVAGKHFNQFAFLSNLMPKSAGAVGTIIGACVVYSLAIALLPFLVGINFYRNYVAK